MGFNFQRTFREAGLKAKNKIDSARLELKINECTKEINEYLKKIGLIVYDARNGNEEIDEKELEEICITIASLETRVKKLRQDLKNIKTKKPENVARVDKKVPIDNKEQKKYTKINIKEEDLRVIRTQEGIKILKFCPSCNTGNSATQDECVKCGRVLKK